MPKIYQKCDEVDETSGGGAEFALCKATKWHPELTQGIPVTFDLLYVSESDAEGHPTLKLHGYPCAAVVKINPYKARVLGAADVLITIDRVTWDGLDDASRVALMDHELTHLERQGEQVDDLGRPKLKMRLHDVELGVFSEVMRRHKTDALDTLQCLSLLKSADGQFLMSFMDDQDKAVRKMRVAN